MKKPIIVLIACLLPIGYIAYKIDFSRKEAKRFDRVAEMAKVAQEYISGKITYAESQRRDAKLRLDDKSISDSERLAGIEYQLTLLRIATEERAR